MIAAVDLHFSYTNGPPILSGFNETFQDGEISCITGSSGRGKSTLLYLLGLMLKPKQGGIFLDGVQVSSLKDWEKAGLRASQFGFVFQDSALDASRSIIDNVCEAELYRGANPYEARGRATTLLERFNVQVPMNAKPSQISGGQAQRIGLARALMGDPDIILCDEPTGNLDQASASVVLKALTKYADEGGVVIIVTHDRSVADLCHREIRL